MSIEALDLLRERIRRHAIDCDWRDGCWAWPPARARAQALLALGRPHRQPLRLRAAPHRPCRDRPVDRQPALSQRRVHDPRSGHLHPLKYTLGLARAAAAAGATLHEHSPVQSLQHGASVRLRTPRAS
jgi:gamma-glutamylputrescine oxidase